MGPRFRKAGDDAPELESGRRGAIGCGPAPAEPMDYPMESAAPHR